MRTAFLPYCRPDITHDEIDAVVDAMSNGWLTSGPRVREFETAFAQASGVTHAVAVNSCTAALHLALLAVGVGPGDEVVTPSLTFVAGAQCAIEIGATPVFCDVDPTTLCAGLEQIAAAITPLTKAIIILPYAGRPFDIRPVVEFAHARGIAVIEDAAHAAGMLSAGTWAGTYSDAAAYSFYATKNVASAEGGMLVTNAPPVADRVRVLSLHGMSRDAWKRYTQDGTWRYDVEEPGFKYNMPDVLAAIGLVQLRRLSEMQARRERIAARYLEELDGIAGLAFQAPPRNAGDRHSWCMFVVKIERERAGIDRDAVIEALKRRNIGTSVHYIPTHHFTAYRRLAHTPLPGTEQVSSQILSLPLFPTMSDDDVSDVVAAVRESIPAAYTSPILMA